MKNFQYHIPGQSWFYLLINFSVHMQLRRRIQFQKPWSHIGVDHNVKTEKFKELRGLFIMTLLGRNETFDAQGQKCESDDLLNFFE